MESIRGSLTDASEDKDRRIQDAEMMYMSGSDIHSISKQTDLTIPELRYMAFGPDGEGRTPSCWFALREKAQYDPRAMTRLYNHSPAVLMKNIAAMSTGIVSGQLQSLANRLNPYHNSYEPDLKLDVDELLKLAQLFEKYNISYRLEHDLSTSNMNFNVNKMTMRDIIQHRERSMYGEDSIAIDGEDITQKELDMVKKKSFDNPKSADDIWQWEKEDEDDR